jgi:hypothetical protein
MQSIVDEAARVEVRVTSREHAHASALFRDRAALHRTQISGMPRKGPTPVHRPFFCDGTTRIVAEARIDCGTIV